jgi:hypothetical protein
MKSSSFFWAFALGLFVISSSKSRSDYGEKSAATEQSPSYESYANGNNSIVKLEESNKETSIKSTLSSSAAVLNKKDTTHQFVRTADLKFKVKNVIDATYSIERIIAQQNGFVTYTNLHSIVNEVLETPVGNDSLLETTKFNIVNSMVIRVPNTQLDTALKSMANLVAFLDYRIIKADDVALQMKANRLSNLRNNNSAERLTQAVLQQRGKLNDINTVEESIYERESAADAARIENLALRDKIEYSTVNIELYQHTDIKRSLIINDKNLGKYEPSLAVKLWHSLRFGWSILETVLLFFAKFWPLGILAFVAYLLVKRFGK